MIFSFLPAPYTPFVHHIVFGLSDKRQISNQITELEGRMTYLLELLSTQKIEPEDYRKMKAEYTDKIEKLLGKLTNSSQTPVDFDGLLNTGLQNLLNLERLYKTGIL